MTQDGRLIRGERTRTAVLDQARRDAGDGERPAVVLSEVKPGKRARRLVVLEFGAWAALIDPVTGTGG